MPLYAILVREHFGVRIMGAVFGAAAFAPRWAWPWVPWPAAGCTTSGSYAWLFLGSSGIGLGALASAFTFRPPREAPDALPSPGVAL